MLDQNQLMPNSKNPTWRNVNACSTSHTPQQVQVEPEIISNPDSQQLEALRMMNEGRNVFLSGGSASNRSSVLDSFLESNPIRRIIVFAPNEASALSIKGPNIYEFFSLKSDWERSHNKLAPSKLALLKEADVIVINNINEVTPFYLDVLDICLAFCHDTSEHFAGKQIIVTGDFQGPHPADSQVRKDSVFGVDYSDRYAFFSNAWLCAEFHTVVLTHG